MPAFVRLATVVTTTAGTPVAVSNSSLLVSSVIFYGDSTNTGNVYFGDQTVTTSNGIPIAKNQGWPISFDNQYGNNNIIDLSTIYFDSDNTGNKVRVAYIKWITPNALS